MSWLAGPQLSSSREVKYPPPLNFSLATTLTVISNHTKTPKLLSSMCLAVSYLLSRARINLKQKIKKAVSLVAISKYRSRAGHEIQPKSSGGAAGCHKICPRTTAPNTRITTLLFREVSELFKVPGYHSNRLGQPLYVPVHGRCGERRSQKVYPWYGQGLNPGPSGYGSQRSYIDCAILAYKVLGKNKIRH